jgi:hypothetical protein
LIVIIILSALIYYIHVGKNEVNTTTSQGNSSYYPPVNLSGYVKTYNMVNFCGSGSDKFCVPKGIQIIQILFFNNNSYGTVNVLNNTGVRQTTLTPTLKADFESSIRPIQYQVLTSSKWYIKYSITFETGGNNHLEVYYAY